MNDYSVSYFKRQNLLHTLLLLTGMLLLLGLIGWLIAGGIGAIWALVTGVSIIFITPKVSPKIILRLYGARRMPHHISNQLSHVVQWLSDQGHLSTRPELFYIPSNIMLAFSTGMNDKASIAISEGLLRQLNLREMTAVLAHEISHIQSNDIWVMSMADIISRLTQIMSLTGYLLILFYIPVFIFTGKEIPWLIFILLLTAPIISSLMQLALSRTREFNADMQACKLTGDPEGLISALTKINYYEKHWLKRVILPNTKLPNPSLLRTHPLTEERIERLIEITQDEKHPFTNTQNTITRFDNKLERKPKHRITGLWH